MEPEHDSEQTYGEHDPANGREDTRAGNVTPDFLAETERLWAIDVDDAEMAIRFLP